MSRVDEFELQGRGRQSKNDPAPNRHREYDDSADEKLEHTYPFKMTRRNRDMLERVAKRDDRSMQYILTQVVWPAVEKLDRG